MTWADVVAVLLVFWLPVVGVYLTLIWRGVRRLRREAEALRLEMRTTSAEGFPPPDPPTTDSLS